MLYDDNDLEEEVEEFTPYRDRNGDWIESLEQVRLMEQFDVYTIADLEDCMDSYQVD